MGDGVGGERARITASIFDNPDSVSIKRVAWAYGCARKGSTEETNLLSVLLDKAAGMRLHEVCAFCLKARADVSILVRGPRTFICGDCVSLCAQIVEGHRG